VSYLNNWDKTIPNLDVVDDYKSEKNEILACQGKFFPFSFGDVSFPTLVIFIYAIFKYVVKILMGGVDSWFDQLDETRVSTDEYGRNISASTANTSPQTKYKSPCSYYLLSDNISSFYYYRRFFFTVTITNVWSPT
jgi:hypothetical protein